MQRYFNTVARFPEGVHWRQIMDIVYADDPNGGPDGHNVVSVTINNINKKIRPQGWEIAAFKGGPGSVYKLVQL